MNVVLRKDVLSAFIYFDFFEHPLRCDEVWKYCAQLATQAEVRACLNDLVEEGILEFHNEFYALKGCREHIEKRISFLTLNRTMMKRASWMVSFLKHIPFVRGIAISGSLSKAGVREDSDIDYFIITKKNRVWFVKAIAILVKKTLFLNSHKYLCVNYLLAEDNLELEKKNRFQATEAVTLIPMYGKKAMQQFFEDNEWMFDFFPNMRSDDKMARVEKESSRRSFIEPLFAGSIGRWLEGKAKAAFEKHGEKRYRAQQAQQEEGYFEYSEGAAVLFPKDFEQKVLETYQRRVDAMEPIEDVALYE